MPIISAVGIAGLSHKPDDELTSAIQQAKEKAVRKAYAEGKQDDTAYIQRKMHEARLKTEKKLLGG